MERTSKNTRYKLILFLLFSYFSMATSGQNKERSLPLPKINYENALFSGNISSEALDKLDKNGFEIRINNPFSGEMDYIIPVNKDGDFSLSIPVICQCFGVFAPESNLMRIFFWLTPGKETKLDIRLDENQKLTVDCEQSINFTSNEVSESIYLTMELFRGPKVDEETIENYSFNELIDRIIKSDKNNIKKVNSAALSEAGKQFCIYDIKIHNIRNLFDYWHLLLNKKKTSVESSKDSSFLSYFNLNDPYYLYSYQYANLVDILLSDSVLQIPPIGEQPAAQWLKEAKSSIQNILGFDKGLFYDVLVASAYERCLKYRLPFTNIQKKNISDYFTNDSYSQFLFAENENLLATLHKDSSKKVVVNETPNVPKESMLNEIIKKHKGKVVFIDFWATWCGPCIHSLNESELAKEELKELDVTYIYITNMSSPKDKWEVKIQGLEGEHYRLDGQSWEYIMDQLNFSGIPSYLIYDKEGVLIHKQTMFMGKEKMIEWINELR